jgi:Tol biopolymer transport system component
VFSIGYGVAGRILRSALTSTEEVSGAPVAEELERVLQSAIFRTASRSSTLLRFLVEETVNGRADRLKDYTLGAEALGRGDNFDPRTDPIARVEASRLRSRLELYYATEGASDPVVITLPKGGYIPRFNLRSPSEQSSTQPRIRYRREWWSAALVAAFAAGAAASWWLSRPPARPPAEMRLEITTPPTTDPVSLAISPDGSQLVFVASAGGTQRLWLRLLKDGTSKPLAGTEHASLPFWSPDSGSIGFFADGRVKRIDIDSGRIEELSGAVVPGGGTWNEDGLIVYANTVDSPLERILADGTQSEATPVTTLAPGQIGHRAPHFLPDGRHFIYFATGSADVRGIHVGDVDGTSSQRLFDADTPAVYAAGHLLYVHQGTLFARRFDPERLTVDGDPAPVAEHVTSGTRAEIAALSASAAGPIAYRTGSPGGKRQFVWFDRAGRELMRVGSPHSFGPSYLSMAPDSRRIAVQRTEGGNTDIWLVDLVRGNASRFTTDPEADIAPLWSPDGERIVYSSRRNRFNLYERPIGGTVAMDLLLSAEAKSATDWSSDGRFLLFRSLGRGSNWDIWALPMSGERKPVAVVRTKFDERDAQFSPDGRWIAYQSNQSGHFEIYLQRFPGGGEPIPISTNGGAQVRWRGDGRELFYLALDGRLTAVRLSFPSDGGSPEVGTPVSLFARAVSSLRDIARHHYIVSADGERFLFDTLVEEAASPVVLLLNWMPPKRSSSTPPRWYPSGTPRIGSSTLVSHNTAEVVAPTFGLDLRGVRCRALGARRM